MAVSQLFGWKLKHDILENNVNTLSATP